MTVLHALVRQTMMGLFQPVLKRIGHSGWGVHIDRRLFFEDVHSFGRILHHISKPGDFIPQLIGQGPLLV